MTRFQQKPVCDEFAVVCSWQTFYHTTLGLIQDVVSLCKVFGKSLLRTFAINFITTGVTGLIAKIFTFFLKKVFGVILKGGDGVLIYISLT